MSKTFDINKAVQDLKQRGLTNYKCPICGKSSFSCQGEPSTLLLTSKLNVIELKSYVPALLVTCETCGHIDAFNLLTLNAIIEGSDDDK